MSKILLIEDDFGILNSLDLYLSQSGFTIKTCDNGDEAVEIFEKFNPDIIVLDINLPGKNGIQITKEIRDKKYTTPIIILSARGDEEDKVMALDLGVDDYVSKPFSPRELLARINSILKRIGILNNIKSHSKIVFGKIELDVENYEVKVAGISIRTTKTEFLLLKYFIENKDGTILRKSLMKEIMGYDNYLYDRTIDTHIKNLRKKLGDSIEIHTIRGIGYKIETI